MFLRRLRLRLGALPLGFRDLLRGSFWLILASGWGQGSMLLANLIVANVLGVSDYGRFALLQSAVIGLAVLAQAGFGVVIAQRISALRAEDPSKAGEVMTFCFVAAAVLSVGIGVSLYLSRDFFAATLFRDPELGRGIALVALSFPWLVMGYVQQGLFTGLERFRDQTRISFVLSPLIIVLPPLGALWRGYEGAMLGLGLAYLLRVAVTHFVLSRILRREGIDWLFRNLASRLQLVWRLALPVALGGIVSFLAIWGGQTLLVRIEGGHRLLGLFAAALTVKTVVMFIPAQMAGVLLPILSRLTGRFTAREWRSLFFANLACTLAITLVLVGLVTLFASEILALFGADFAAGESTLLILMLTAPFEALCISIYQGVQSQGRFWPSMLLETLPKTVTVLIAAALLIPGHGADGLAYAWLLGWLVGLTSITLVLRPWSDAVLRPDRSQARPLPLPGEDGVVA